VRRSAELTLKPLGSSPQEGTSPYTTYTESTYLREGLVLRIQEKGGSVTYTGKSEPLRIQRRLAGHSGKSP
jgi:predicted SPOUT superfamily RNA methylase MTH1